MLWICGCRGSIESILGSSRFVGVGAFLLDGQTSPSEDHDDWLREPLISPGNEKSPIDRTPSKTSRPRSHLCVVIVYSSVVSLTNSATSLSFIDSSHECLMT